MNRLFLKTTIIAMLVCCASTPGYADVKPQVRGQKMRDFMRLTFEWPETTLFTAKTSGNNVILTFDRKVGPNMGEVLKQLHPVITKAEKKADGKTIVLTLDKPHRIRTFISDNVSGIDVLDIKGGKAMKVAAAEKEPAPKTRAAKKQQEASASDIKPLLAKRSNEREEAREFAELAPAAGMPQAQKQPVAAPAAETATPAKPGVETKPQAASPAAEQETKAEAAPPSAEAAAEPAAPAPAQPVEAKPTETAAEAPHDTSAAPPEETKSEPAAPVDNTAAQAEAPAADTKAAQPAADNPSAAPVAEVSEASPATPATPASPKSAMKNADAGDESGKPATHSRDAGVSMVPMTVDQGATEQVEKSPDEVQEEEAKPMSVEASEDNGKVEPLSTNKIVVSSDADGATLRFPLKERVAMAVFNRMNHLWVVFDRKLDFDLSGFDDANSSIVGKAVTVPNDHVTILRIPVSDNIYASIRQQEGIMDVAVLLAPIKHLPDAALDITISTEPPAPAHVFVPALEAGATIEAEDPDIGDTLSITPIFTREQGIAESRNFVDFSLLPSTQGLVIAKKADTTEVTALRNGLRVSLPGGANLSPQSQLQKTGDSKSNLSSRAVDTLFPDDIWALEKDKSLKLTMTGLFNKTVFAPNDGARNLARLRMAQLYLREGLMVEAIGMLDNIKRTNPSYYRSAKLSAMRGAANFLLYRFNDAAKDFSSAELNNNLEVEYWRNMLSDLLGNPQQPYDYLALNGSYISKYPPIFRQRLAIVAADRAIAARDYNVALKIFDTLTKDGIIAPIQSYVDFLTAKISAENGQEQEALDTWKRLSGDDSNKFVQARAKFATIMWQLDNNEVTRDQATDLLERLRLGWHGDGLELQIVQLLGDLYFEKQDYVNAMRVWQIGVTGFKNTGPAIEMARKMEDVFVKLFNEGIADKMTPLEALALYYEYRAYTPAGSVGSQMIEKLADRLVAVDLLSTSAQLLEQQMRTQMEKTERSRVGAKLADIYLMNNQPKRAMKSLQDSVYGDNPILLRIYRNQLTARAMLMLGRPEEALTVLGQDESVGAEKLRSMIYWNEKNWPNMVSSIENIFKKRPDPSEQLTLEEGEYLVRLALAYVFQNDSQQLQYLRDYFMPLMKNNPYKQAFEFVTAPDIRPTTRNFDDLLQSLSNTRGFINNYKARLQLADSDLPAAALDKQP